MYIQPVFVTCLLRPLHRLLCASHLYIYIHIYIYTYIYTYIGSG